MIQKKDLILAISKSGESKEVCDLIPAIKFSKIKLCSITEDEKSTIAAASDVHLRVKVTKEACPNDLAPTSSTTVTLALGDAIAISLLKARGFTAEDFAKSHPGGKLGKKLTLRVKDLMTPISKTASVKKTDTLSDLIVEVSSKKQGLAVVTDKKNVIGVFSDGDLRRCLQKNTDIKKVLVGEVMTRKFKTISSDKLVIQAANMMSELKIFNLLVKDSEKIMLKSSSIIFVIDHWTFDQVVMNSKWCHFMMIKDTKDGHVRAKSFTSNLNELVGSIIWSTLREGSKEGVVVELELVVCEVNTVESKINKNLITSTET